MEFQYHVGHSLLKTVMPENDVKAAIRSRYAKKET
jgi:hypothetical protein